MQGLGILFLFYFITLQAIIKPQYVDQIPKAVKVSKVVPKSYQWEGQPRKTENELTNDR